MGTRNIISAIFIAICGLLLLKCANRGRPEGGDKDIQPPKIEREIPPNYSTNFKANEIRIYFDEYVKINELQKQLIISPPMDPAPDITPLGTASKYIKIVINDTLDPNTTYSFNFGESIVDNNEGNAFSYYKYVFSTGDYIDSLTIKGQLYSAEKREVDEYVSIMLYEIDSSYSDSIIFKERPRYITNTLDSTTTFSLENLKAGKYKMVAIKDNNSNYTFEQKSDKIGFYDGIVNVPTDSLYSLTLFKEKLNAKVISPRQESGQKIAFGFEGDHKEVEIRLLEDAPDDYEARITKDEKTDTLFYWYKPKLEMDSAQFYVRNKSFQDTLLHRFRDLEMDSLIIKPINSGLIDFGKDFQIFANIPLVSIDTSKITMMDKDSIRVRYDTRYDSMSNTYTFDFEKEESEIYKVEMLPGSFNDFFENTNDTIQLTIRTKAYSDFSNIRVVLSNATYPLIIQLTDDQDVVKYERSTENEAPVDFRNIPAGTYYLRVILDSNGNGEWDSGNFLLGIQPERIIYDPEPIPARPNFDFVQDFAIPEPHPDRLKN